MLLVPETIQGNLVTFVNLKDTCRYSQNLPCKVSFDTFKDSVRREVEKHINFFLNSNTAKAYLNTHYPTLYEEFFDENPASI